MLRFIRLVGVLGTIALSAAPAVAGEYQCKKSDSALRIAIEVEKAGHTLPCEVVAEDDRNDRAVLYSAQYDRDYCPERLEKTRAELESEGWVCQKSSDRNIVQGTSGVGRLSEAATDEPAPEPAVTEGAMVSDSRSCRLGGNVRRIRIEVENPTRGKPCALIYWSEQDRSEEGQLLWRAQHDAEFCPQRLNFIVEKWTAEGWQCDVDEGLAQETALSTTVPLVEEDEEETVSPPSPAEPDADVSEAPSIEVGEQPDAVDPGLQAIIEADAKRIGEWMEVDPAIDIAAYGDLNGDGRDDVVVFLAYQSDQSAYRQYLMSYLAVDESYELAGVKLLTGVSPPPDQAKVIDIDDGVIWLDLSEEEGGDAERIGYSLRDQQLIEVDVSQQAERISN